MREKTGYPNFSKLPKFPKGVQVVDHISDSERIWGGIGGLVIVGITAIIILSLIFIQ